MSEQEWNEYIDKGHVPMHFFKSIVKLIQEGKKLNSRHLAVYMSHGPIIEALLKSK